MDRIGIDIPESAKIILLQEQRLKKHYNELIFLLNKHDQIISTVKPLIRPLLQVHLDSLELEIR